MYASSISDFNKNKVMEGKKKKTTKKKNYILFHNYTQHMIYEALCFMHLLKDEIHIIVQRLIAWWS